MFLPDDGPKVQPLRADHRLPCDEPFTTVQAAALGITARVLRRMVRDGLLRRPFASVYVDAAAPDDTTMRAKAVALILPPTAVVVDETAAWVRGLDVMAPADHVVPPPLKIFQLPGNTRVRKSGCTGGERTLRPSDIEIIHGVPVLTSLRIACDLGRLLSRERAFAALDAMLRTGDFTREQLLSEIERFRGMRGVVQLRELAPLADGRAASPGESILRLRWIDAGMPTARPQVPVGVNAWGEPRAYLDLGSEELRFGAEYDGHDWHTTPQQREHDRRRRAWLRDEHGWTIVVFTKAEVFAADPMLVARRLHAELLRHCRRLR